MGKEAAQACTRHLNLMIVATGEGSELRAVSLKKVSLSNRFISKVEVWVGGSARAPV